MKNQTDGHRPSLRDRQRANWDKRWAEKRAHISAYNKRYSKARYKKICEMRSRGELPPIMPKAKVLFDGMLHVLELVCVLCDTAFLAKKSKSNHRPKLCPLCQASSSQMQKKEYDERSGRRRRKDVGTEA